MTSTVGDTPARLKAVNTGTDDVNLTSSRAANSTDIGDEVPQIELDHFFAAYLPKLPVEFKLLSIVKILNVARYLYFPIRKRIR